MNPQHQRPRHLRIEQSPLERARLWVEIAAFVAAGCWAVYTFAYQTRIAPLFQPAHEVVSIGAQRLGATALNYLERVDIAIRNDGNVDVDTAALAVGVFAGNGESARLESRTTKTEAGYRMIPPSAWTPVGGYGSLLDGAVDGRRGEHYRLSPGDSVTIERVVVVPRRYRLLYVRFETFFDRFPIRPRVNIELANVGGAVLLKSESGVSIDTEAYFGV
jgi:hypothetical protein